MQLVAYGAQDVYLTGNPQITFWKVTYRRHTNFAVESIEQTFNGQADFGRRVQCTVSRNGDLAYRTYLQVTLPEVDGTRPGGNVRKGGGFAARWLDYPGEQLVSQVEVEIGGQRIDRQFGDWMHIWNQLSLSDAQRRGYEKMVGQTTNLTYLTNPNRNNTADSPCAKGFNSPQTCEIRRALPQTTLYVPLQFWFCRNPGLAIPLIALQYHEVKINLEFNTLDQCLWAVKVNAFGLPANNSCTDNQTGKVGDADFVGTAQTAGAQGITGFANADTPQVATTGGTMVDVAPGRAEEAYNSCCLVSASLFIDYVFLDTDERRRMAQNPHEYLIEQLQFTGDESIGSTSNKIKLNFNHPCKELIWVVQPDAHVDYCASFSEQVGERACDWDQTGGTNVPCCGGEGLYSLLGAQPFNYSDAADMIPRSWLGYGSLELTSNEFIMTKGDECCSRISRLANPWACNVTCGLQPTTGKITLTSSGTNAITVSTDDPITQTNTGGGGNINGQGDVVEITVPTISSSGNSRVYAPGFYDETGTAGNAAGNVQGNAGVQSGGTGDPKVVSFDPKMFAFGGAGGTPDRGDRTQSGVSTAGTIVLGETSRKLHCWGKNPVVTAKLLLNGQDRFSERLGSYFDVVQPFQHHTASPDTGINVYSFALRPEEHQPSGTCNFSRIDNASLQLVVSSNSVGGASTSKVRVYATNYNVLRVMSGMGGLAYSN